MSDAAKTGDVSEAWVLIGMLGLAGVGCVAWDWRYTLAIFFAVVLVIGLLGVKIAGPKRRG